jgi:hypothetical protein
VTRAGDPFNVAHTMAHKTSLLVAVLTLAAGCHKPADKSGPNASQQTATNTPTPADSGSANQATTENKDGMLAFPAMRSHLDSMVALSADQLVKVVAAHDSFATKTLDGVDREMKDMGMKGGSRSWNALVDSIKADVADLPTLKGADLVARMKEHARRLKALMDGHERMMKVMH